MPALPTIYVDFNIRDPDGRLYSAQLGRFPPDVALYQHFIGTDYDEFTVECEVLAIDRVHGKVLHRPVDPSDVPGTNVGPVRDSTANGATSAQWVAHDEPMVLRESVSAPA